MAASTVSTVALSSHGTSNIDADADWNGLKYSRSNSYADDRVDGLLRQRLGLFTAVPTGTLRLLYMDVKRALDDKDTVELAADLYMSGYPGASVRRSYDDVATATALAYPGHVEAPPVEDPTKMFYNLRHEYVVVDFDFGRVDEDDDVRGEVLVETRFREHFEVPRRSASYARLLESVPTLFVGTRARLECAVRLLCSEMHASLRGAGLDVPPWRTFRAILSKWNIRLPTEKALVVTDGEDTSTSVFEATRERTRLRDFHDHVRDMQESGWYT